VVAELVLLLTHGRASSRAGKAAALAAASVLPEVARSAAN
jgi:hypothetical protein